MSRNISDLHPTLQKKVQELKIACALQGLNIGISECFRTVEEQDALYAQGRTTAGAIVTNAKGAEYGSMHQWGVAFDFYLDMDIDGDGKKSDDAYNNSKGDYYKVGAIGRSLGLEWGGSWSGFVDLPHFQLPDWGSTPFVLKKQYGTPDRFKDSWKKEEEEMTKSEIQAMIDESIRASKEKVYNNVESCPNWAQPTIKKLIEKQYLVGDENGNLNVSESALKIFVINDRAGLY